MGCTNGSMSEPLEDEDAFVLSESEFEEEEENNEEIKIETLSEETIKLYSSTNDSDEKNVADSIMNHICANNKHWLDCDTFYAECSSNLEKGINTNITDEKKKTALQEVVQKLKNKKASLKSKTHQFCKKLKEKFESIGKFTKHILESMKNVFRKMLKKFLAKLYRVIYEVAYGIHKIVLAKSDIYYILQSLPILNLILKKRPKDDVLPPKDGFYNWALTVEYKTKYYPLLKTEKDVKDFIKKSQDDNHKCRFVSYGHSFSPVFGEEGTYMGKIIEDKYTGTYPPFDAYDKVTEYGQNYESAKVKDFPMMYVELVKDKQNQIKLGGATSNVIYTQWMRERFFKNNKQFTPSEPANVLQYFQGFGGTHSVGCHGAGITTTNLPFYIKEMTIIDANNKEHTYSDTEELKKVTTNFGMLGFTKEMTLQYDDAYYATFQPLSYAFDTYFPDGDKCEQFQKDVNNSYYNEFFWFPYLKDVYVNVWNRKFLKDCDQKELEEIEPYPSEKEKAFSIMGEAVLQTINELIPYHKTTGIYGYLYQTIISASAQAFFPLPKKPIKMLSCDALHFRWGIQNCRVLDMEWSIPLRRLKDDKGADVTVDGHTVPDVKRACKLWRIARDLLTVERKRHNYPQCFPVEMRILRGNEYKLTFGFEVEFSCTIEILTLVGTESANEQFYSYCQTVTDAWAKIADEDVDKMRPHWGKWWQKLYVKGKFIDDHLHETYKQGWKDLQKYRTVHDPNNIFLSKRFSNIMQV